MRDDFYTFGGGHFWEDVFFYQKWRIQRNYVTKKYRLLDNWDIRRHEGSFEECREAFVKYIEAYEIARPSGHMIIMIHSLGQSKNIFKPLWRRALQDGFMAAAINYPSTQKDLDAHVKQFHFFMEHLEDIETVSFITLGVGNLIVQELFKERVPWQTRLKFKRCIFINPFVSETKLVKKMCNNKVGKFIVGPMGNNLIDEQIDRLYPITLMDTGVIRSDKPFWLRLVEFFTHKESKKYDEEHIINITGAKDVIKIPNYHLNIFNNNDVCNAVMSFLVKSEF